MHGNYQDHSIEMQVSDLIGLLNKEVQKIENQIIALSTWQKCLMQKGFLSLLDNMTEMLRSISVSSSARRPGGILERRQENMQSPYRDDCLGYRDEAEAKQGRFT